MVTWEDKRHNSKHLLHSFFFPQIYVLSVTSYGMEYPFGQLGSAVPVVTPAIFLCTPKPTGWWAGVRGRKGLDSV